MLPFDVKFMAMDSSSTNINITQDALLENGHSSAAYVRYDTLEMLKIEMPLFNVKFMAEDSSS